MNVKKGLSLIALLALICSVWAVSEKHKQELFLSEIIDYPHKIQPNTLFKKADAAKYAQDYRQAEAVFKSLLRSQSLSIQDSQYVLNQLAYINLSMNEDSAAAYWIQQLEKKKHPLSYEAESDYFYNIGTLAYHTFKPKMAETYLKKALNGYQTTYGEKHLKTALCLTQIGHLMYEFSDYVDSIGMYIPRAYDIFQVSPVLKKHSASCELGMAFINYMKRGHKIGEVHCDNAIYLITNSCFKDTILLARAISFKGQEIKKKGDTTRDSIVKQAYYSKAESYLNNAIDLFKNKQGSPRLQELYRNLIIVYIFKKDTAAFFNTLNKIKEIVKKQKNYFAYEERLMGYYHNNFTYDDKKSIDYYTIFFQKYTNDSLIGSALKTEALYCLIESYNKKNIANYDKAIQLANVWLSGKYNDMKTQNLRDKELYTGNYKTPYAFIPLSLVTNSFLGKYAKSHKISDLKAAVDVFKLTDSLLFNNMTEVENDIIMKFQWDIGNNLYPKALQSLYEYYHKTHDERCLNDAFLFIERMKSEILYREIELLNSNDSIVDIKTELENLLGELDISNNHDYLLTDRIAQLNRTLHKYIVTKRDLENPAVTRVEDIRKKLQPQQALLLYNLDREQRVIHCLYVSQDSVLFNQSISDSLNSRILFLSELVKDYYVTNTPQLFVETAVFLYQKLLKPFEKELNNKLDIIISPDRGLHHIPFESLVTTDTKTSYDSIPYWIKKNNLTISYTPSWKIFNLNMSKMELSQNGKMLYFTYGKNTKDLPCSERELDSINTIFTNRVEICTGHNCRKSQFLNKWVNNYDILAISLHAQGKTDNIFNNKIWFQPNNEDALYGFELTGQKTNAKLVVLSACETNVGNTDLGEGVYSLARYFFQSGTKSIAASLWQIENCPNSKITSLFYRQISQSAQPKQALSEAKRLFLNNIANSGFKHPGYWAGMVLVN